MESARPHVRPAGFGPGVGTLVAPREEQPITAMKAQRMRRIGGPREVGRIRGERPP